MRTIDETCDDIDEFCYICREKIALWLMSPVSKGISLCPLKAGNSYLFTKAGFPLESAAEGRVIAGGTHFVFAD